MVSIGPNSQSYNFTHMFNIPDLRSKCDTSPSYTPGSLMDIISKHPELQTANLLVKSANMENIINDIQANFTIFLPSDKHLTPQEMAKLHNVDRSVARQILLGATLDRRITAAILEDNPSSYFLTKSPPNRLFVYNISGKTYINNDIHLVETDIEGNNGLIHIVDCVLWPTII